MYLENSARLWKRIARARALEVHFELALRAYELRERAPMVRHMEAIAMLPEGGTGCMEYIALTWRLKLLDGDRQAALETARLCVHLYPQDVDSLLEFGQLLVDSGRSDEAIQVLEGATRLAPDDADLWYELGVAAEHAEQWDLRYDAFHRVWAIERANPPEPRPLITDERASEVVDEAIARLPASIRGAIGNVAVIVEDYPEEWVLAEGVVDPRILGLFDGPTHAGETSLDAVVEGPSRIYLFRRNIERLCVSPEDAEHQIAVTVLHELGHYFGFDEPDLERLGLN
jgi:predicted Zn-dependent protease with MMP-like domain